MIEDNYEDIINLPHYEPKNHIRMSIYNRAAQFAPFAALTGYEELVNESSRLTDCKIELNDEQKSIINNKLQIIQCNIKQQPKVKFVYFAPDSRKKGGTYKSIIGNVKKMNSVNETITMTDNRVINILDILSVDIEEDNYNLVQ